MKTTKEKLNVAYRELRKLGYVTKHSFACCGTCGYAAMREDGRKKFVFYTGQALFSSFGTARSKELTDGPLFLMWGGDGREIISVLKKTGLPVEWNGAAIMIPSALHPVRPFGVSQ